MEIIRNQADHGDDQVDQLPGGHALQKRGKFGEELIWTWSEYHTQVSTLLVSCIFTQPKGVSLTVRTICQFEICRWIICCGTKCHPSFIK